ncbi:MAG TPA: peptidylprolyl isomerase [Thermoanaerobaculia bacterium]|nr:peptidylprolyl isomerase [Thermoanaerobaculia bacterium]
MTTPATRWRRLGREPLVHFLAGGALLFALDGWLGSRAEGPSYELHVGAGQIERLRQAWEAQSGRPPNQAELAALIEDHIREEIFYREALRRGLDDGDILVRRRLAQKLAFLIEDLALIEHPREDALRRFHAERTERYVEGARVSFRHVFFSRDRRVDPAADAAATLAALRASGGASAGGAGAALLASLGAAGRAADGSAGAGASAASAEGKSAAPLGDPFMLHSEYAGRTHQEVRELFGVDFADALFALAGDGWQGPVRSSYGEHLVQVIARAAERVPPFEEVREAVARDLRQTRRVEANEAAYRDLRSRYEIVVGEPAAPRADRDGESETAV